MLKRYLTHNLSIYSQPAFKFSTQQTKQAKGPQKILIAGNLYTWGGNPSSLGYHTGKLKDPSLEPHKVEVFDHNVVKVAMGPYHSAVITAEGDLYTFGKGSALGHGEKTRSSTKPRMVEFFRQKDLRVIDAVCGEKFTLAITADGTVWSWGSGQRLPSLLEKINPFSKFHAHKNITHFCPEPVQGLPSSSPFNTVIAGFKFGAALNDKNELYYWGRGDYGVFGDGRAGNLKEPKVNKFFKDLHKKGGMKIKRIKACGNSVMALFNNGTLWAWGENISGQLATDQDFESTSNIPTQISVPEFKGQRVESFDLGEEISVILTNKNRVYWSGLKLNAKPELLVLPEDKKIVKVAAANNSIAVVSDDGMVYMKEKFVKSSFENLKAGIALADLSPFFKGKIVSIGGAYNNKYTIVQEK